MASDCLPGKGLVSGTESTLDYLRSIYFDATTTIRHYDGLRATFTQIFASLITIFLTVVTAATVQGIIDVLLPVATAVLAALSVCALLAVLKINYLIDLQRKRAATAMRRYQDIVNEFNFMSINEDAKRLVSGALITRVGLGNIWAGIFFVLLVANLSTLFVLILSPSN